MDPLLALIVALALALFAVTVYVEWLGVRGFVRSLSKSRSGQAPVRLQIGTAASRSSRARR